MIVVSYIVTVQSRREWPAKSYKFRDQRQANMFAHSCQRDGDYRVETARAGLCAEQVRG